MRVTPSDGHALVSTLTTYTAANVPVTWNGPICPHCHRGYLGSHECRVEDLQAQIDALLERLAGIAQRQCFPQRAIAGSPQPPLPVTGQQRQP